eukprot:TRINITY_DN1095_c0_g1_i1.p1 TRINITY_DN1095_c0_g1~~TRINITY_DN1095_c0_g1_i1.p1  ORF type:complete len:269 (+),score=36.98 TRINITY_DN1095_c0_g1_i1:44-850(+)
MCIRDRCAMKRKDRDDVPMEGDDEYVMDTDQNGEIVVNFDCDSFDPLDIDPVRTLLRYYIENYPWNALQFAKFVVSQKGVGSIIRVEENIYGFISVINMHVHKQRPNVAAIRGYLDKICTQTHMKARLNQLFTDESQPLGLVLNERVINVPPEIAPPLHTSLYTEINTLANNNPEFRFKNYIIISRLSEQNTVTAPKKKTKTGQETVFHRPEEEIYKKEATFYFIAPLLQPTGAKWTFGGTMTDCRLVMVVSASKVNSILSQISQLCK